jgi:hypothetical protein
VPDGRPRRPGDRAGAAVATALLALAALAGCGADSETATQSTTAGAGTLSNTETTKGAATATGGTTAGGGLESSLPPQAQVDLAIKSVLASGVPGLACGRYSTERYVKTTFGGRAGCVQSTLPASAADTIAERKFEIHGNRASVTVVPSGGPSDGETIKVGLVRAGSVWKVDTLHSNAPVGP